jgi:hypothetical protein
MIDCENTTWHKLPVIYNQRTEVYRPGRSDGSRWEPKRTAGGATGVLHRFSLRDTRHRDTRHKNYWRRRG